MFLLSSGFGSLNSMYPSKGKLGTMVIFLLGSVRNEDPHLRRFFLLAYGVCTGNAVIASYPYVSCLLVTRQGTESLFVI